MTDLFILLSTMTKWERTKGYVIVKMIRTAINKH